MFSLDYNGPSPIELLSELLSGDICSHLISSYWIYQLCHGKNFRQYHEENTKTHQYSLGALEEDWETKQFTAAHKEKTWDSRLLNKITVGEIGRNAIELSMSNGSPCDIRNNKPRETIVKYVCAPKSPRAELLSVQEIATCSYIAIASVPSLCRHPDFAPTERQETSIFCVAENKPVKMLAFCYWLRFWKVFGQSSSKGRWTITLFFIFFFIFGFSERLNEATDSGLFWPSLACAWIWKLMNAN